MALGPKNPNVGIITRSPALTLAAGPLHFLDCGALHPILMRAVILREYGKYKVGLQKFNHDGEHTGYEAMTELTENDAPKAAKQFAMLCLETSIAHPSLYE